MQTLGEVLSKAGVPLTAEEERAEAEERERKHRGKAVLERPKAAVPLFSLFDEPYCFRKVDRDPTPELISIPVGMSDAVSKSWFRDMFKKFGFEEGQTYTECCYVVVCPDTLQAWFCSTRMVLDMNFVYRKDLLIQKVTEYDGICQLYQTTAAFYNSGMVTRKSCYILDSPANESYEVYYDSNYPALKYGKATPNGMFVHKYDNRFHRDMAVLELEELYSNQSSKKAGILTKREMGLFEAIVVSDGCWMSNSCSSSFYYIDNTSVVKMTQGFVPSEPDQAVLISEVVGAYNALRMCYISGKRDITYYYDNTSILNVFRNRKTEYIEEVSEYKGLLEMMNDEGYKIKFVELHPKTGDDRDSENRALMFFHNYCDKECREMADIFKRDYKDIAALDKPVGKTFGEVKKEFAPKGKPGRSTGSRPKNNSTNGNNRYGRRV